MHAYRQCQTNYEHNSNMNKKWWLDRSKAASKGWTSHQLDTVGGIQTSGKGITYT